MSDRHVYECDACGWEETVFCDGRQEARLPWRRPARARIAARLRRLPTQRHDSTPPSSPASRHTPDGVRPTRYVRESSPRRAVSSAPVPLHVKIVSKPVRTSGQDGRVGRFGQFVASACRMSTAASRSFGGSSRTASNASTNRCTLSGPSAARTASKTAASGEPG